MSKTGEFIVAWKSSWVEAW